MEKINKLPEPQSLLKHRTKPGSTYENLPKHQVRISLISEQGYICCYCMQRIKLAEQGHTQKTKIEHFACQADPDNAHLELNYHNLLLSCMGGEGFSKHLQTCDTYKGDKVFSYHPCDNNRNVEDLIKYRPNGEIYSDDPQLDQELSDVLNLNNQDLVKNRRIQFEFIQKMIRDEGKKRKGKAIKRRYFEDKKNELLSKRNAKFNQFCMIGVYILNKKLRKY